MTNLTERLRASIQPGDYLTSIVTTAGTDPESGQHRMIVRTTEAALSDAPALIYRRVRIVVEDAQ